MERSAEILKQRGLDLLHQPRRPVNWVGLQAADQLIDSIDETPHAFVLACLMDRQIPAERAWQIPYKVGIAVGGFSISSLSAVGLDELTEIFRAQGLHRFNTKMAEVFYLGVDRIRSQYGGDAANIWRGNLSSKIVVRRFLEFQGAGPKIATMATNILAREFKIPMSDYSAIDISADVHIRRVFTRLGYVRSGADVTEIVRAAWELNPTYPGVFDLAVWEVGRNWCRPTNPNCEQCYLNDHCPKIDVN